MVEASSDPFAETRDRYVERLKPIFLPPDPISNDIIRYFASLLRVLGMEDRGWDPYAESRAVLNDINGFFNVELPPAHFKEPDKTPWRLGLLLYSHIVEMDAPYEVLTNLLRFQLGKGYSPNPFFALLSSKEQKNYAKRGITTGRKIALIKELSAALGVDVGDIFDDFYDNKLRNAIAHSDYILTDDDFRCRGGLSGTSAFTIAYADLDKKLLAAKAFVAAFFQVELLARQVWGQQKGKAIPYDAHYKGLMEVLVDGRDVMCGFKVHWPNNSESMYRRTDAGIDMDNCMLDLKGASLDLFVGLYARTAGAFSPLVEHDGTPTYTKIDGADELPTWPDNIK
ncbi:hypothetical protein [Hyphomicrobium sp.]|uniref:hypothetical protein n=1 Tax=Hyphomicrobium sp. TaxID=82 RepID=UPI002FE0F780